MASSVWINLNQSGQQANPISLPNGAVGAPALTWNSDLTSGRYRIGSNNYGEAVAGVLVFDWNASRLNLNNIPLFISGGYLKVGTVANAITTTGAINIPNAVGIYAENAAGNGILTVAVMNSGNQIQLGDTNVASYVFPVRVGTYNNVPTAGNLGLTPVYGYGDVAGAINVGTASIATYTVGAADGTFEVSANCLVTTSTTHSFSLDCTYTDESNVARTLVIPVAQLAGTFVTSGLITNVTGAGPYESAVMTIRCKAATVITVRTSAGGTFTTVTYNARGAIKQVS